MDENEQQKIIEESAKKINQFQIEKLSIRVDIWKTKIEIQKLNYKLCDLETKESSIDYSIDKEEDYLRRVMEEHIGE